MDPLNGSHPLGQEGDKNIKKSNKVSQKEEEAVYNQKVEVIKTKYCPLLEKLIKKNKVEQVNQLKIIYNAISSDRRLTMESLTKFENILEKILKITMKHSKSDESNQKANNLNKKADENSQNEDESSQKADVTNQEVDENHLPDIDKTVAVTEVGKELSYGNVEHCVKKQSRWDVMEADEKVISKPSDFELGVKSCFSDCKKKYEQEKCNINFNKLVHVSSKFEKEKAYLKSSHKNETIQQKVNKSVASCNLASDDSYRKAMVKIKNPTPLLSNNDNDVQQSNEQNKPKDEFSSVIEVSRRSLYNKARLDKTVLKFQAGKIKNGTVLDLIEDRRNSVKQFIVSKSLENELHFPKEMKNFPKKNFNAKPNLFGEFGKYSTRSIFINKHTDFIDCKTYNSLKTAVKCLGLKEETESSSSKISISNTYKDKPKELRANVPNLKSSKQPLLPNPVQSFAQSNPSNAGVQYPCDVTLPQGGNYFNPVFYNHWNQYPYQPNNQVSYQTTTYFQPGNQSYPYFPNYNPTFQPAPGLVSYPILVSNNGMSSDFRMHNLSSPNGESRADLSTCQSVSQNSNENFNHMFNSLDRNESVNNMVGKISQPSSKYDRDFLNKETRRSSSMKSNQERMFDQFLTRNPARQYHSSLYAKPPYRENKMDSSKITYNASGFMNTNNVRGQGLRRDNNIVNSESLKPFNSCQIRKGGEHLTQHNKDCYVSPLSGLYCTSSSEPNSSKICSITQIGANTNLNINVNHQVRYKNVDETCSKAARHVDTTQSQRSVNKSDMKHTLSEQEHEEKLCEEYGNKKSESNDSYKDSLLNINKLKVHTDGCVSGCTSKPLEQNKTEIIIGTKSKIESTPICNSIVSDTSQEWSATTNVIAGKKVTSLSNKNNAKSVKSNKATEITSGICSYTKKSINTQVKDCVRDNKTSKDRGTTTKSLLHKTKQSNSDIVSNRNTDFIKEFEKTKRQKHEMRSKNINISLKSCTENNSNSNSQTETSYCISENNLKKSNNSLINVSLSSSSQITKKIKSDLVLTKLINNKTVKKGDKHMDFSSNKDKLESKNGTKLFDIDSKNERTCLNYTKKIKNQQSKEFSSSTKTNLKVKKDSFTSVTQKSIKNQTDEIAHVALKLSEKCKFRKVNCKKRKLECQLSDDCLDSVKKRKEVDAKEESENPNLTATQFPHENSFSDIYSIENVVTACSSINKFDNNVSHKEFSEFIDQSKNIESKLCMSSEENPIALLKNLFQPETIKVIQNLATLFTNLEGMKTDLHCQDPLGENKVGGLNKQTVLNKELSSSKDKQIPASFSDYDTSKDSGVNVNTKETVEVFKNVSENKQKASDEITNGIISRDEMSEDRKLVNTMEMRGDKAEEKLIKNIYINNCSFIVSENNRMKKDASNKELSMATYCACVERNMDSQVDKNEASKAILDSEVTRDLQEIFQKEGSAELIKTVHQGNAINKQNNKNNGNLQNVTNDKTALENISHYNLKSISPNPNSILLGELYLSNDANSSKDEKNPHSESSKFKSEKRHCFKKRGELEKIHDSLKSLPEYSDIMKFTGLRSCRVKSYLEGKSGGNEVKMKRKYNRKIPIKSHLTKTIKPDTKHNSSSPFDFRIVNVFSVTDQQQHLTKSSSSDDEYKIIAKELVSDYEKELNISPFRKEESDGFNRARHKTSQKIIEDALLPNFHVKEENIDDYE